MLEADRGRSLAAAASVVSGGGVSDLDAIGDSKNVATFDFLFEGLLGDSLEGELDVDGFLGRGFEVRDVSLGLAPGGGTLGGDDTGVFHINLVTQNYEGEVLRVAGSGLDQELLAPAVQVLERLGHVHIEDEHAAVSTTIEGNTQRPISDKEGGQS